MKSSIGDNAKRHFSDVHVHRPENIREKIFRWFSRSHVVNLRPSFYERYQGWVILSLILIAGATFGFRELMTRGEVADFSPATCLGTWENPSHAQGEPDTFKDPSLPLDHANAAIYPGGPAQIFCGGFVREDFKAPGDLKSVGLMLAWRMEGAAAEPIQESIVTSTPSEILLEPEPVPEETTSTPPAAETVPEEAPAETPEEEPSEPGAFIFLKRLASHNVAHAQEEPAPETPSSEPAPAPAPAAEENPASPTAPSGQEPAPEPQNTNEEEQQVIILPPLTASLEETTSTAEVITEATTTAVQENVGQTSGVLSEREADEHFLVLKYSFDGQDWVELARIGKENWQNFTITMPVSSWEELKKVQIRVEGIPTLLSEVPKMYLDGMVLEAHYDLSLFQGEEEAAEIIQKEESAEQNIIAPEIIYSEVTSNGVHLKIRYFGPFFGERVDLFMYPSWISVPRNSAESNFTFAGEFNAPVLDAVQLLKRDFNESNEIEVSIVGGGRDGEFIPLSEMMPGKYKVDMSYFDGKEWHLTQPQSFDWPPPPQAPVTPPETPEE